MKLNERVRALRREREMTQEQLAEAMGVSAAAVSKWESGQSVPDMTVLIELADYFEVSLDALVGYEAHSHRRKDMVARVRLLGVQRSDEVIAEVREALRRYPNHFDVVWTCAKALGFRGMERDDESTLREALSLMDRAMTLLPQNTDPSIRRDSILTAKGMYWSALGDHARAIAYYEEGNANGVNDVAIGNCHAAMQQYEEALIPLSRGMATHLSQLYNAMYGLLMARANMGCEEEAAEMARWCAGMLAGLEASSGSYLWKMRAAMLTCAAVMSSAQGKEQEARAELEEAVRYARQFDEAPEVTTRGLRYYYGEERGFSDDMGERAIDVLAQAVRGSGDERLLRMLRELA